MTPATPDKAAADLYDALDAEDVARVDTRAAFISGYRAAWPRGLQAGRAEVYALRGQETAALDGLATNGPAQAYTMGYEAGQRAPKTATDIEGAALGAADRRGHTGHDRYIYASGWAQGYAEILSDTTTSLEALAVGGYTPEQQARADALAAASRMLAGSPIGWGVRGVDRVLDIGRALAAWIEHGDPKACAPIPCPPLEETSLTIDHRFEVTVDGLGRATASCVCGWIGETAVTSDVAYQLWVDHAEHVEDAIGLALGTIKDNPDLGDRVDQALDAAKMAQPRARPTADRPNQ